MRARLSPVSIESEPGFRLLFRRVFFTRTGIRYARKRYEGHIVMTIKAVVFDAYGTLYDVQSVADVTDEAFPGYGDMITQVWRMKQLEYSWLRSLMQRYEDFSIITRDSLAYTLRILGLTYDESVFERIMEKYLHLDLYSDATTALAALRGPQARDPLQRQHRHAQCAGAQQRARPRA